MQDRKKQNRSKSNDPNLGEIRLIGGEWRSRKLVVPTVAGLRPTSDRVRETLFNWLQAYTNNSKCLDVCAGSGALGFEALSRGAASVQFVETNTKAIQTIEKNAQNLGVNIKIGTDIETNVNTQSNSHIVIEQSSILDFLAKNTHSQQFDIIFVDPPFALNLHVEIFEALQSGQWLTKNSLVYCEMPANEHLVLPSKWGWFREKRTKNLAFGLIAV